MSTWNLDKAHSIIGFSVKHLVVSTVKGQFTDFSGTVMTKDDSFEDATISFSAHTSSISTNNTDRDTHLRAPDMFDSENFPELTFVSKSCTKVAQGFKIVGDLTIKNTTKEVVLDTQFDGIVVGMSGKRVAVFSAETTINRIDFGVSWNAILETGGMVVSENVKIEINAELIEA